MNDSPVRVRSSRARSVVMPRALALPVALSITYGMGLSPAAAQPVIPSQQQVDQAKAAVSTAAGSVAEIDVAFVAASRRLAEVQNEAGLAEAAAQEARALLDERSVAATAAEDAARQAAGEREAADRDLRRTAAQIYQEQGSMSGVGAYLGSDGPQELADRSAVLSVVGDLRQHALQRASATANREAETQRAAVQARSQQESAAKAADEASASAASAARAAADESARIGAEQEQRVAALAAARQTSVEVEKARTDGLARQAAEEEAARRAAEEAAIQARLQAEAVSRANAERAAADKKAADAAAAKKAADAAAANAAAEAAAKAAASQAPQPVRTTPPATAPTPANPPVTTTPPSTGGLPRVASNTNAMYAAIRGQFGISTIYGYRAGDTGDHGAGKALDVMIRSFTEGDAVAAWAQTHTSQYNVKYIIWKQRIWFPGNGPNQWRMMEDRGSITQNHYDHVHISLY